MEKLPTAQDLWFLPLGGSGEIGMNLNLYGHDGQWLMVDLGVTFNDRHGIEVITPDPEFIVKQRDHLQGLILTHAHEDHLGAVPYLWPQLRCPIYATKFTAEVLRQKLKEHAWAKEVPLIEVPLSGTLQVGKFQVEYITLTHSIPEPNALAITTPLGTIMHTGDWKIDPDPLVGAVTDAKKLIEWGDKGVLALVCDSTNVFADGVSGSEEAVRHELSLLIGEHPDKRIVMACFASNVARLETAIKAAQHYDRRVCLMGRSMDKMVKAAKKAGYLQDIPAFIDEEAAMSLPPSQVMILTTGSQGEPRAALSRMAAGTHPHVKLSSQDVVFFSSRVIPGNEKSISVMQNNLVRRNVILVTSHEEDIHVSGHPARDELAQMYNWVRPQILIPVHGELRHMTEQAQLALECGVPQAIVPENGTLIQVDPQNLAIIDRVKVGRLGYDGNRMIPLKDDIIHDRSRMASNGTIFATVIVDRHGNMTKPPHIGMRGLCREGVERTDLEQELNRVIRHTVLDGYQDSEDLIDQLRTNIRRAVKLALEKRPSIEIHVVQL